MQDKKSHSLSFLLCPNGASGTSDSEPPCLVQKVQQGQPLTYNQLASPGILCWWALTRANNSFVYFTPVLTKSSALKQLQKSPLLSVTPVWWWNTEWCRSYWHKLIPAKRFCNKNPSVVNHPHYKAPLESSDDTNQLQQSRHSWP